MSVKWTLRTCLVANRGEIAVRIIRACRELGIRTVAVYSKADVHARHVEMADAAYLIGAAPAWESYLNTERLLDVARTAKCDCVHPGYGFLSESEVFAQAVVDAGLTWVGPSPSAIRAMGVKTEARALMEQAGVPLVPGFHADGAQDDVLIAAAARIGLPVMVKAAGGGGGKGIRVVHELFALPESLAAARHEADAAFGDGRIFLEKFIERGRHIEIQVLADSHGNVVHLFERECSVQRRHQKIVEETPSPLLDEATRARMGAAAVAAARAVGYVNAGTVEFIVTPSGDFYFLEMNTRLQVEHAVTECVTGVDLVKLQFGIAAGDVLPFIQADLRQQGHAIECRIYAEDPANGFLPAAGHLLHFKPPAAPGVRVDSGVQSGDEIGIHYDPMIAKIIAHDRTRAVAIQRMNTALRETVILGLTTNLEFLRTLLQHPTFAAGEVDTGFVERHLQELLPDDSELPVAALIAAALQEMTGQYPGAKAAESSPAMDDPWLQSDSFRVGTTPR
ncbi:MAG: acetyl-CoA carboxylase biotin carboxylase subunit [Anaerolineae bacterium]|nr:acetyl-CoA carboxylase biotin carboxylase subunit [Anaerolineae bacterium]